jgi:ElaA protein
MLNFVARTFEEMTNYELYDLLKLRQAVFVVEQNCVYLDTDDLDQEAIHVLGFTEDGKLAACTRLLRKGIAYRDYPAIGRVITGASIRGRGQGRPLMQFSIDTLYTRFGRQPIKISAQAHLQSFYSSLGFEGQGADYLEDGIPHRAMILADPK